MKQLKSFKKIFFWAEGLHSILCYSQFLQKQVVTEQTKGIYKQQPKKITINIMANCARFVWQYSMIVVAMSDVLQTIILRSYLVVGLQKSKYHNKIFIS